MKTELQKFIDLHKGYSFSVDVREGNKTIITANFSKDGSLISHGRYSHLSQQSQEVLERAQLDGNRKSMKSKNLGLINKICPTKRTPDAGDSAYIPSSFTRLIIFLAGRLRRPRPHVNRCKYKNK